MVSSIVKSATFAVSMLVSTAEAHNKMTLPLPTWPNGFYSQNSPSGTIDPTDVLPVQEGMSYGTDPLSNTKAFWSAFNASSFKTLRGFLHKTQTLVSGASKECGFSVVDGTPRDLPDMVQWDFFTSSHGGPLAVYCDDTLVAESWNAAYEYPKTPANVPYEKAKCKGASVLSSYWLALHSRPWQVYTNCAPLTGASPSAKSRTIKSASNSSSTSGTTSAQQAETPAVTPIVVSFTDDLVSQTTVSSQDGDNNKEEDAYSSKETSVDKQPEPTEAVIPTDSVKAKCSVRRRSRRD
ncbi:unnamed protein product [Peronospora belbahrii]|uniref:Secreted protein n=1 Tax=Peronospora belbahrii TaxID=622444 RepID=A0AAU9L771_9STRA|nr:unnamed protein product [Peronospora belbahrii]CAH0519687.1 unnamed protein product [Peronospora belbahrii]